MYISRFLTSYSFFIIIYLFLTFQYLQTHTHIQQNTTYIKHKKHANHIHTLPPHPPPYPRDSDILNSYFIRENGKKRKNIRHNSVFKY